MIKIRDLTKAFGPQLAVRRLDLDIPAGQLVGLLVLAVAFIARTFGVIWYVLAGELVLSVLIYRILNRTIQNRPPVRTYDDLFSYGRRRESE